MEETLRKLKETHNEKDFIAIVESMRRKIKKGTLDYNLYLFESTFNKLDDNKPDVIDRTGEAALSGEKVEEQEEEKRSPQTEQSEANGDIQKLNEIIDFCEQCCRNFDQEIILSQLEEESKELLEGFRYE